MKNMLFCNWLLHQATQGEVRAYQELLNRDEETSASDNIEEFKLVDISNGFDDIPDEAILDEVVDH